MTDEQIKKLAAAIAQAQADYAYGEDKKGQWGAMGKGKGTASRNNYNVSRWVLDLLAQLNAKLDRIIKKLGA